MSWFSKVGAFLTPLSLTLVFPLGAEASRITFHGEGTRATLEARPMASNAEVAPIAVRLELPGIDITKSREGFDQISVDGLTPLEVEGNPALFTTGSMIAVPNGFEPRLTVISQETKELNGVVVKPSQKKFRCEDGRNELPAFPSALYRSNAVYPESAISLEEVGRLQDVRLVRIALNPLQMDMGRQALKVTSQLVARVDFVQVGEAKVSRLSKTMWSIARNVTVNGQANARWMKRADSSDRMLLITAEAYKETIAPFVAWKRAKGITVNVVTYAEAGGTKEKVQEYIKNHYAQAAVKPTFLMFVGNKATAPAFMESTGSGSAASDWRFALLSGDDNIPDMLYGRIIADNADEVTRQANRLIAYERSPDRGAGWYHDAQTIASNEGSGPSDKEYAIQVQDALRKGTYKAFDSFFNGDGNATPANITAALAQGRSWIAYFGHGSGTSWASTNGSFSNTHVAALQNTGRLPVIIDVACLNSSWVNLGKPFGKAWVTHQHNGKDAGAVAFYGGSVSISWHPPAVMSVGVAKYHFEKPVTTLGGSVLAGQIYLIEKMGTGADTLDNMKWYNLFGDPSLLVRTDTPKAFDVKLNTERVNGKVVVTLKATDGSGAGVSGLTASLAVNQNPLAVSRTNSSGEAVLNVDGVGQLEPGTQLTVTGYNTETYESTLQ